MVLMMGKQISYRYFNNHPGRCHPEKSSEVVKWRNSESCFAILHFTMLPFDAAKGLLPK
jgi:hypothetical protein